MTTARKDIDTRQQIAELLSQAGAPGRFTARRTAADGDLQIEVRGVGRLRFPVSRAQARRLCGVARPARYGRGRETLLDRRVRDTWQVPKSRVKIDRRRWNRTLLPVLEGLRADLGLPEGSRLKAELHSMLVYAPGQFFHRHRDSEKDDAMVGTLVVTLPSRFTGGAIVVEHQGEKVTYRASRRPLSFAAFYADCYHEVRPVKEGYRIVLTYNLMLQGGGTAGAAPPTAATAPATVDALAACLRQHFDTPRPPRHAWQKDAPPRDPPNRLVYLLDHRYTERGFGWHRLKGDDAARVAVLRAAAERGGYEVVLALAEIHETWGCMEPGWDRPWQRRHRGWRRDEDDDWQSDEEPSPADDPDAYELDELYASSITLDRWLAPAGAEAEPIVTDVDDDEVCSTTPSSAIEPYASEYEGYMGNYGNTMDRWYRRGAVVLWPRERRFAVRAEASPAWALEELQRRLRAGAVDDAREKAVSLLPFWAAVAPSQTGARFFAKALAVAADLDRPTLAASLLRPFRVEALKPPRAPALARLVERYGEGWTRALFAGWSDRPRTVPGQPDRLTWLASLPSLCEALRKADGAAGTTAARLLVEGSWNRLVEEIETRRGWTLPTLRQEALAALAKPILGALDGAAVVEAGDLLDASLAFLTSDDNEALLPCLVQALRTAWRTVAPARRAAARLEALGEHCARRLETMLAEPPRHEDDWSIAIPPGCPCDLCGTLATFLADRQAQRLAWPLAKEGRRHIHARLDAGELPVRHETQRSGRPYTLVLTKTKALFDHEAQERRSREADLAWLTRELGGAPPERDGS